LGAAQRIGPVEEANLDVDLDVGRPNWFGTLQRGDRLPKVLAFYFYSSWHWAPVGEIAGGRLL